MKGSYTTPRIQTLSGRKLVESLGHAIAGGTYGICDELDSDSE